MINEIFREGEIDGFVTRHKLTDKDRLWSDRSIWKPVEVGTLRRLYLVKCVLIDSDQETNTFYYVCHLDRKDFFREENNFANVIDHTKYDGCYWSVL